MSDCPATQGRYGLRYIFPNCEAAFRFLLAHNGEKYPISSRRYRPSAAPDGPGWDVSYRAQWRALSFDSCAHRIEPFPSTLRARAAVLRQSTRSLNVLRRYITGIAAVCILAALVIGISLARGITSPVQGLVSGMREVLKGNFAHRLEAKREDEIGFLANSFNEMVTGLEEREKSRIPSGRFVSRDVAEAVLSDRVPLAGERREVSISFKISAVSPRWVRCWIR